MKIAVIGLGLIGGSIAKALRMGTDHTVLGTDQNETILCKAELMEAIDGRITPENLSECDVVILAIYPQGTLQYLKDHAALIKKDAIVLDSCGVKQVICAPAEAIAKEYGFNFIGAHPMAGRERVGFDASIGHLFRDASMILTPPEGTPIELLEKVKKLVLAMGFSHVVITTPHHHDEMIAFTSQLAHVVSSAYVQSPRALEHYGYSAGSYRDMTRVATLNEHMWTELFLDNPECLSGELNSLIERLQQYSQALHNKDADALRALLRAGREQKEKADGKVLTR